MYHDPRGPLGSAGLVESIGYLVEADDPTDAGQRIEPAGTDCVEGSIPVLRHRAATELHRHPRTCG